MSYLQAVGAFAAFDGAVSILDGLAHGDGPKAHLSRIARLVVGVAFATQVLTGFSKPLGIYLIVDGAVSLAFKSIASGREQSHLTFLRLARIGVGLLAFFFL